MTTLVGRYSVSIDGDDLGIDLRYLSLRLRNMSVGGYKRIRPNAMLYRASETSGTLSKLDPLDPLPLPVATVVVASAAKYAHPRHQLDRIRENAYTHCHCGGVEYDDSGLCRECGGWVGKCDIVGLALPIAQKDPGNYVLAVVVGLLLIAAAASVLR